MALLGLNNFTDAVVDAGAAALPGLAVVEAEIEEVVETITKQLAKLKVDKFEADGHISPASFGGGERVDWLSYNYTGAHRATVASLEYTRERLVEFQVACRKAREEINEADLTNASQFKKQTVALEAITQGAKSYWGDDR